MYFFRSILAKILVPVILMTIILVAVQLTYSTSTFSKFAQENLDRDIRAVAQAIKDMVSVLRGTATDQTRSLAQNREMIAAVKEGSHDKVQEVVTKFESDRKCTFFTILDTESKVIFRTSKPEQFGDTLHMRSVDEALKQKKTCVYYETTKNIPMCVRAASPIFDETGNIIGVVNAGFRFDTDAWVDGIKERYDVECTTFLNDEPTDSTRVATTVLKADGTRAVGTKLNNPPIYDKVVTGKQDEFWETMVVGKKMKVFYSPLYNDGDEKALGIIFAGIPVARQTAVIEHQLWSNISITAVGLLFFGIIVTVIVRAIVLPIRKMTKAATDLADGHLDIDVTVKSRDESAALATAFKNLAESLKAKTDVALAIAKGDLTVWVPLRSEHDNLGLSLIRMRYSLYDSLKDLTTLTNSVYSEVESLTQANQDLVNNTSQSSEQLKEVTTSIRSLHTQTVQNAENARNAENLTQSAKTGSNDGREKMGRMVQAMDAITKSSSEIKNIIRVIDDIAFQTNLLALNAAVEAARAGQHGKGFAVVAEEVRNLASRSAKAASETAGLIEESIKHVGMGSKVASETSESLNLITDQVEQINKIVSAISGESDQQAQHLGTMTNTVELVNSTAATNAQSVAEVSNVITSITGTAQKIEGVFKHFKSNPGGAVMLEGEKYDGYVPPHGTRFGFYNAQTND